MVHAIRYTNTPGVGILDDDPSTFFRCEPVSYDFLAV